MTERDTDVTEPPPHPGMDQFTAHLDRGWDLVHRGDLRGAQLSAEKSLEVDPQAPEAHNLLGYVKAAQGQAEDALELYRTAIALDDTFVEAMLNAAANHSNPYAEPCGEITAKPKTIARLRTTPTTAAVTPERAPVRLRLPRRTSM